MSEAHVRTFVPPSQLPRLLSESQPLKTVAETTAGLGRLQLRLEDRPFLPGQTVRGELVLDYSRQADVRRVGARFSAIERVVRHTSYSWCDMFTQDRLEGEQDHDSESGYTQKLVFDQEKNGALELGEHKWRFSFELSRDACPNHGFAAGNHRLVYSIEGFVDIPMRPDVVVCYALEVRPTLEQHMNMLMQLPNYLTATTTYQPFAELLGPAGVEEETPAFKARLWANRPQVLSLKTATQYIQAQLEVTPARVPVQRVIIELKQAIRPFGGRSVIHSLELPFQSIMDIHMTIDVDENDLQTFDRNLFHQRPTRPCVNMYSFRGTLVLVNYVLVVRFEMQGLAKLRATPRLLAEIPVTFPEVVDRVECLKAQTAARAAERQLEVEVTNSTPTA